MLPNGKLRTPITVFLLALLVLAQACAGGSAGKPAKVGPPDAQAPRRALTGCSGEPFRVDLLDAIGALPEDTLDAQREQLRDWIWTVTLGRIAQRAGADEVLASVADEPLARDDALAHVLHMQVGPTRSTSTKSGGAVVLVEAADAAAMAAEVAEALDQEALHIGSTPADAQVYQYVFQPEVARAEVCAMKPLARAEIESAAHRYRSATVTTAGELEGFLSGGVDLLSAQCTESGLQLTGRQRPRNGRASVTLEHIAALSQARGTRYLPLSRFGFSLDQIRNRAQLDANARRIDALRAPAEIQPRDTQVLLAWKRQNPGVSTQELMMSLQLQQEAFGAPGFSLDPHTSVSFATKQLDHLIGALPDARELAGLLRAWGEGQRAEIVEDISGSTNEPFAAEARAALIAVRGRLQKASRDDAEGILHTKLPDSLGNDIAEDLLQLVWKRSSQQCARYDGPLTGTATGMTFFYTDLLAKVWSIDLDGAAPEGAIQGFASKVHPASSAASCEDDGAKNTRTWFGVREESFAREPSGAVRFAPIATRIFAKSSDPGAKDKEFEPTAESRRFVQWWDAHFPEIAAWEPQYEVLNQLMKWSVVVHSTVIAEDYACLALLDDVAVRSDHRIDRWVEQTRDLRWRGPVSLLGPPEGVKETEGGPECLLLLESKPFSYCGSDSRSIAGGVTAATLPMVLAKPARAAATPAHLGRLGGGAAPQAAGAGRVRFETVRGSGGELKNVNIDSRPNAVKFVAEIDTVASQVGRTSSWDGRAPVKTVEKHVEIQSGRLVGQERKNGLASAELKTSDLDAADVRLEVKPSSVQAAKASGQELVKRIQQDGVGLHTAAASLARKHKVVLLDDGRAIVHLGGDGQPKTSVLMASGSGNRGPPPPGTRVSLTLGAPDGAPHRPGSAAASRKPVVEASILDEAAANALIAQKNGKVVQPGSPTLNAVDRELKNDNFDQAMKVHEQKRTPAAEARLLEYAFEKKDVKGVGRVVDHAIRKRAPSQDLEALRGTIALEAVRLDRAGEDRSALDGLVVKIALAQRKQLTPGSNAARGAASSGADAVYAPASYHGGADLPPPVHPPGKVLLPDEQYVTRVIDEVEPRSLPASIEVGGTRYERRAAGKDIPLSYAEVGSPYRLLLGYHRRAAVITRCVDRDPERSDDDQSPDLPPCHERPSPEEWQRYKEARACDRDGDHEFTMPEERACLDALRETSRKQAPPPAPGAP
ncbi:hypothetical protein [Sorangium sp. So ce1182]|uniref:hypothetical protein n=1 Tax=Sorangium sp. So ce1182 TaxID=3133334 RepID=UPI003F62BAF6